MGELLAHSDVILMLDLFPEKDAGEFKISLRKLLTEHSNKKLKNVLAEIVPAALTDGILKELMIAGDTPCHSVSTEDRAKLALYLKRNGFEG